MWVNVKRADTAMGSFVGGQQMYVEYMVPSRVRKPFPIVLVHGGGGQGLDWMGTPDGRPGWFQYLAAEGYRVYVVDRPGHGRSPLHPTCTAASRAREHDGGAAGQLHSAGARQHRQVPAQPHAVAGSGQGGRPRGEWVHRLAGRQLRAAATAGRRGSSRRSRRQAGWARRSRACRSAGAGESAARRVRRTWRTPRGAKREPSCSTRSARRSS